MKTLFAFRLCPALLFGAWSVHAVEVELVSKRSTNTPSFLGETLGVQLSKDGKWAALTVSADNPEKFAYSLDVFLRNVATGEDILVSRTPAGTRGNDASISTAISDDGRFVLFESEASDLVPGDDNEASDAFFFDRTSGGVMLVNRTGTEIGNGESTPLSMSPDGRFILFSSEASNLTTNDLNETSDIFLFDRVAGTLKLVTQNSGNSGPAAGAVSNEPLDATVSSDGRFVGLLSSATNLVTSARGITENQVYLRDMELGTSDWLTWQLDSTGGKNADRPRISTNGEYLAFITSDLIIGPASVQPSTFLHAYNQTRHLRIGYGGPSELDRPRVHNILDYDLTPDGTVMVAAAEYSAGIGTATNVLEIYDNGARTNGVLKVSGAVASPRGIFRSPRISADGKLIYFTSNSPDLPGNGGSALTNYMQLYVHDLTTQTTRLVSTNAASKAIDRDIIEPVISANGTSVAFVSTASDLPANDGRSTHAYVLPESGNYIDLSVIDARGSQVGNRASGLPFRTFYYSKAASLLSADGRFAAFTSEANDLVPGDDHGEVDVFLRDLQTHETRLVSSAPEVGPLYDPTIMGVSPDGRRAIWRAARTNAGFRPQIIFVYDIKTGLNSPASILPDGSIATDAIATPQASGNGRFFYWSPILQNTNAYIRDLDANQTTRLSSNGYFDSRSLGNTGKYIIYFNYSNRSRPAEIVDWVNQKTNFFNGGLLGANSDDSALLFWLGRYNGLTAPLYIYNPTANSSNLVSTNATSFAAVSGDGSTVAFSEDTSQGSSKMFIFDRASGTSTPVLLGANGPQAELINRPVLSSNGRFVAFSARGGSVTDPELATLYVLDRALNQLSVVKDINGALADTPATEIFISADGQTILFDSLSPNLVPNDWNVFSDVFVAKLGQALTVSREGNTVRIFWKQAGGTLQETDSLNGTWRTINNAQEPHIQNAIGTMKFFRVVQP